MVHLVNRINTVYSIYPVSLAIVWQIKSVNIYAMHNCKIMFKQAKL